MRKNCLILILLFPLMFEATGQQTNSLDSQLKLLVYAKEDTNKVNLLLNIEKEYFSANEFDSALYYNNECEKLISKIDARQYEHK